MSLPICVLVLEDEPLIRMDIVDFLHGRARNRCQIQVMFTDIDMPGSIDAWSAGQLFWVSDSLVP